MTLQRLPTVAEMGTRRRGQPVPKAVPLALQRRAAKLEATRQLQQARTFVKKRDGGRCRCCGKPGAEVHHLVFRSQRGDHDPNNLLLLCKRCHEDIHAHLIDVQFGGRNKARTVRFHRKEREAR